MIINTVIEPVKIMQNYTVCITKPIRDQLKWKKGDQLILSLDESGAVRLTKAITTLDELIGIGKETFAALGGGEAFIKSEREAWGE